MSKVPSPQIILHAGGPKTGSSSIQMAFSQSSQLLSQVTLDNLGFRLLSYQKSSNLSLLASDIQQNRFTPEQAVSCLHSFDRQIQLGRTHSLDLKYIFSSEHSGYPGLSYVEALSLSDFLQSLGRVSVLFYVRHLLSLSHSLALHGIKATGKDRTVGLCSQFQRGDHTLRKILFFRHIYGMECVTVVPFQRNYFYENDVRLDFFCRVNGLKHVPPALASETSGIPDYNSPLDLSILRVLQRVYADRNIPGEFSPPGEFIHFLNSGLFQGDKVVHRDLFTPAQIMALYGLDLEERVALKRLEIDFSDSLKPVEFYLSPNPARPSLDSSGFVLSKAQRTIIRDIITRISVIPRDPIRSRLESLLEAREGEKILAIEAFSAVIDGIMALMQ